MSDKDSTKKKNKTAAGAEPKTKSNNRFARRPKTTAFFILVAFIVLSELASYLIIVAVGHRDIRRGPQYNRQLSGYTVFKNSPHFNFGSSYIKADPSEPDIALDENGFLTDVPLTLEKKPNTIRIFVLGGSTAFGGGQGSGYHSTHLYPAGVYSYQQSIAGKLKAYLQKQQPDVNFEVINAASYQRRFHQSVLLYMESISRFSPDFVVNIEGWNDIYSFVSGTPYHDVEALLPEFVKLEEKSHSLLGRSNTIYVLMRLYDKIRLKSIKAEPPDLLPAIEFSDEEHEQRKQQCIAHAARFEQILSQYLAVLDSDKTKLVFVLQPILQRQKWNKPLSPIEKQLYNVNFYPNTDPAEFRDFAFVVCYFFDDYFTGSLEKIITEHGQIYIDANREMQSLDESVEVFSDFCHLLPPGNQFVAEQIGEKILAASALKNISK